MRMLPFFESLQGAFLAFRPGLAPAQVEIGYGLALAANSTASGGLGHDASPVSTGTGPPGFCEDDRYGMEIKNAPPCASTLRVGPETPY